MRRTVEQLWTSMASPLRNFIRSRVRDHAAAEDILQETFLKIHRQLPRLRSDQKVEAWIWRIARNAIADHFRRDHPGLPLPDSLESADDPAADLPDLTRCLRQFLEQLTPAHREALQLTEWENVSQIDLARRLGLSPSGARSRVQRARAELKQLLESCCRLQFDRRNRVIEASSRNATCCGSEC